MESRDYNIDYSIKDEQDRSIALDGVAASDRLIEHKQQAEALRQSEARLAEAQRIAHVGSWEFDVLTGKRAWSEELFRICGLDPTITRADEAQLRASYHPDDLPIHDRALAELLATGQPNEIDARLVRPDGEIRWCHLTARPVHNAEGQLLRVVGTAADITDRVAAEQALRESHERLLEGEQRLRVALMGGWLGWWHRDLTTGQYLEFSDQCKAHYGLPPDARLCYSDFQNLVHPEDRAYVDAARQQAIETGRQFAAEYRVLWPDGSVHWLSVHGTPIYNEAGQAVRFIGTTQDVTKRKIAEEALRERTEVLESVLATIPHQVFWKDRNSVYQGGNLPFALAAGLTSPEEIIGKRDSDLPWTREESAMYLEEDRRVLETGQTIIDEEGTYRHADGTTRVDLISKLPLHDAHGRVIGLLGICQDITARKALEAEREKLLAETERLLTEARARADRDPLTNLLNHRAFHSRLKEETTRAERTATTLAVAVLDLNNFKFFNDIYGHAVGDDVLRQVAQRLRQACRSYDTVARFGGDEFALLMPDMGHTRPAEIEARLLTKFGDLEYYPDGSNAAIPITVSVGVALFPQNGQDRYEVLRLADERLLRAKTGGETETEVDKVRAFVTDTVEGFSMLDALVAAVDNKDRYTRRHSNDVVTYSRMIACELGMTEAEHHIVAVAALVHDVGKIGVPDAILRKPGKLSAEEFEAIKQHPVMGAILVQAVPGLEPTLDAVRHHHERWDGEGYPSRLKAEECPLIARLMAVADAFSAMTTDRPYRKGMERAQALSILQSGAGIQWDPDCVRAFLRAQEAKAGL